MSEFYSNLNHNNCLELRRIANDELVYVINEFRDNENNTNIPSVIAVEHLRAMVLHLLECDLTYIRHDTGETVTAHAESVLRALDTVCSESELEQALYECSIQLTLDDSDVIYEVYYDKQDPYRILFSRVGVEFEVGVDIRYYPQPSIDLLSQIIEKLSNPSESLQIMAQQEDQQQNQQENQQVSAPVEPVYQPPVTVAPEPTLPATQVNEAFLPPVVEDNNLVTLARVQCGDVTFSYLANTHSYQREVQVFVKRQLVLRYAGIMQMVLVDHMVKLWRKLALRLPAPDLVNLSSDDRVAILTAISDFAQHHMGMPEIVAMESGLSDEMGYHVNNSIFCVMRSTYIMESNVIDSTYTFTNITPESPENGVPSLAFTSHKEYQDTPLSPSDIYHRYYRQINTALDYHPTVDERNELGITTPISIIVACGNRGEIGRGGKLPWHIKEDLIRFKQMTTGQIVIMGRNTFASLGYTPLPNRVNIVITHHVEEVQSYVPEGVDTSILLFAVSKDDALRQAQECIRETIDHIFIIGGGEIYQQFIDDVDNIYITSVSTVVEDADAFIQLENIVNVWDITPDPIGPQVSEEGLDYSYFTLTRKRAE